MLLVPDFAPSSAEVRFADFAADVRLRVNVRCYRTGATYSWIAAGHATRVISAWGGMTGSALERALGVLADTLSANRAKLDVLVAH